MSLPTEEQIDHLDKDLAEVIVIFLECDQLIFPLTLTADGQASPVWGVGVIANTSTVCILLVAI
jgi:hypothetical protein